MVAYIPQTVEYVCKGAQIYDSLKTCHETYKDPNLSFIQKLRRLVINIFFSIAQACEIFTHLRGSSYNAKLGAKIAAGVGDVGRSVEKEAKKSEIIQKTIARGVDIWGCCREGNSEANGCADVVEALIDAAPIMMPVVKKYKEAVFDFITKEGVLNVTYLTHPLLGLFCEKSKGNSSCLSLLSSPSQPGSGPSSLMELTHSSEFKASFLDPISRRNIEEILVSDISDWKIIPKIFAEDPILKQWKSCITDEPIRFVFVITVTISESREGVYYEREEIVQVLEKKSEELPLKWPSNVSYDCNLLKPFISAQDKIDSRLRVLLESVNERRSFFEKALALPSP